jgi:Ni/Co efflux regulator RcnB
MFVLAALLFSASLGAAPPPDRTAVQRASADDAAEQSRADDADEDADEDGDDDADRNVSRHRTRVEYVRNLRAKAHRIAVRRVAVAHHRRSYVHQRYLRKPGPFYRPTYRRQQQSSEDGDD